MANSSGTDNLVVKIAGQQVSGWTSYRMTRGVELLPSGLVLEFSERYPNEVSPAIITPGQACTVSIGADLVMTGYADLYQPHMDGGRHVIRAEMRSKTADLVDCSLAPPVALPPWVFTGNSVGEIARRLTKPFGIDVTGDGANAPFPIPIVFPVNPGETVAELLENITRAGQVLMWDDPQGRLVFSNAGTTRAGSPLVEGVNCEVEEARLSMDQQFSVVYVAGQAPIANGHINFWAQKPAKNVPRYRPKLIIMDGVGPAAQYAAQRAQWEVNRRYARSRIVDVTVAGHRDGKGALWQANTIVKCTLPSLKLTESDMLIAEVAYLGSEGGTSTLITAMPRDGFVPQPFYYPNPYGAAAPSQGGSDAGGMGTS